MEIIKEIQKGLERGPRFVSFLYHSKETEETAIYTVLLGVNIANSYRRDLKILARTKVTNGIEQLAKTELIESLKESLNKGVGNNSRFTQKGLYWHISNGIRFNHLSKNLNLDGFVINKQVVKPGAKKPCKHSPKTLAKNMFRCKMKSGRFRCFVLDPAQIAGIKVNGKILELCTK
jgi:hypothetical protein